MARKKVTLEDVIELLNERVGESLYVRDIAAMLGTDEKTVRRHLRAIRERFPGKVKFYKHYRKLVYEALEPLTVEEEEEEEEEINEEEQATEGDEEETVEEESEASELLEES
jgi:predicted transcriptional regulator